MKLWILFSSAAFLSATSDSSSMLMPWGTMIDESEWY
jgi:hypothetical protein